MCGPVLASVRAYAWALARVHTRHSGRAIRLLHALRAAAQLALCLTVAVSLPRAENNTNMPFFMVQHNITSAEFYKEHAAPMVAGASGLGPGLGPVNEGLAAEKEGELAAAEGGEQTLYQHSINFPPGDTKIGWCVFESKPGSKWTAELLKKKQDTEKKDWATQDVYEIMKPAGIDAHYC